MQIFEPTKSVKAVEIIKTMQNLLKVKSYGQKGFLLLECQLKTRNLCTCAESLNYILCIFNDKKLHQQFGLLNAFIQNVIKFISIELCIKLTFKF
jgi:hypothetical protein